MPECWVTWSGDVLRPVDKAEKEVLAKVDLGRPFEIRWTQRRSSEHHRLFFAAIAEAFTNWPEQHEFQPDNPEHLRAWLLCKAGYRDTQQHKIEDGANAAALADFIEAQLKRSGGRGFVRHAKNMIYVLTPKSIAWSKLDQKDFNQISNDVSEILKEVTGMSLDDFKHNAGKAA